MWLIDEESLCCTCIHLNHECDVECGDDYECIEHCDNKNASARNEFYKFDDEIFYCDGYEY